MAVVAVSDSNSRRDDASATTDWSKIGGAGKPQVEPDFFYQGAAAISSKVGTTIGGQSFLDPVAPVDMTVAGDNVIMLKALWTNKDVLIATPSALLEVGSSLTAFAQYDIADDGTDAAVVGARSDEKIYPPKGGWLIVPIDPNETAWYDDRGTAPTLTAIDHVGIQSDFSATSKSENVVIDALDISPGLFLVGGDGGDPDGVFQDFVDDDEGTVGNRFGHVSTVEGIIYVFGKLVLGETDAAVDTATVFTDALQTIVFPGGRVAAGWNGLEFELALASQVYNLTNVTFVGRGRDDLKHFFDSSADQVDDVNEEIDITGHGFFTGDAVVYAIEGGTVITGLVDAREYQVRAVTVDAVSLHGTMLPALRSEAFADTNQALLTAAGTGESHSLRRVPDTRPDFLARGTLGDLNFVGCVFISCRNVVGTAAVLYDACVFVGGKNVDLVGALLTDCAIGDFLLAEGEVAVTTNDLGDVSGCEFLRTAGVGQLGHALEIDTIGTYVFDGNSFTGYGTTATFNASTGVDGGTEVITTDAAHGFSDGEAVFYGDEGGTPISGLADGDRFYVNVITTTTLFLHVTRVDAEADANRINLTAGSSETHHLYSAHASILNSSGGLVTINVTNGIAPTVRNTPGSTTVIVVAVNITINQVVANTQVAIFRVSDDSEIYNEEVVPSSRFWWERLEADLGYDNVWSAGEFLSGTGPVLDEDQVTSGVTGTPDRWQVECLRVTTPSTTGNCFVRHFFSPTPTISYVAVDFIVTAESLANAEKVGFLTWWDTVAVTNVFRLLQDGSGDLRIEAQIDHDGIGGTLFTSDIIIQLDTRYTVELKWDNVADEFEWRITDYSRKVDGALVGPVTQDSGAITTGLNPNNIELGSQANDKVATFYLDRLAIDDTDWAYEVATLEDLVIPFDYGSGPDVSIRIELRKSQFAPKQEDKTILATITSTGVVVNADQQLDDNAAVP